MANELSKFILVVYLLMESFDQMENKELLHSCSEKL